MSVLEKIARLPVLLRIGVFTLSLLMLWLPLAGPLHWRWGTGNLVTIATLLLLYGEFILLLQMWGRKVHHQPHPLKYYGLRGRLDLMLGLAIGWLSLLSLLGLETALGWLIWQPLPRGISQVIWEGLVVALGISFAEELLFRGWLLDELERDYRPQVSLWLCSSLFALLHFVKPLELIQQSWPQFIGLLLLGIMLIWAKRLRKGRLGLPIGIHAGLVWNYYVVDVADLVTYPGQVPDWVTGVDQNPLAGVLGLLFLGGLALGLQGLTKIQSVTHSLK